MHTFMVILKKKYTWIYHLVITVRGSPLLQLLWFANWYGLKQASRQWNAKLFATISALGFKQSQADHSLFVHSSGSNFIALLIYVDDMIITSNDLACVANLKQVLDQKFGIKDLGSLKYFLRLEITKGAKGISINQRKYALDVLKEADAWL